MERVLDTRQHCQAAPLPRPISSTCEGQEVSWRRLNTWAARSPGKHVEG